MRDFTPLVSIVTINYNSIDHTIELLRSIQRLEYSNLEVIVVDNASEINPKPVLEECFPSVIFIRSSTNLVFAGGNNLGIERSRGDFIFFLNNDTILSVDVINILLDRYRSKEEYYITVWIELYNMLDLAK